MLLIDPRAGSKDLIQETYTGTYLLGTRIPVEPVTLFAGDIAFLGNGPDGSLIPVGIEVKKLSDAVNCMVTGRFSGTQLPRMQQEYGTQRWLLIEGVWRGNTSSGVLEHQWYNPYTHKLQWSELKLGNRSFMALEFNSWLCSMAIAGGARLWMTPDINGTVQAISAIHSWWTNKAWEDHRAHMLPDNSGDTFKFLKPKTQAERSKQLVEYASAQIDGVGWGKSQKIAKTFPNLRKMSCADVTTWRKIDGIGEILSARIVRDITGE